MTVGRGSRVYAYDGKAWSRMELPVDANLNAVHGLAEQDFFAVGDKGMVFHYGCEPSAVLPDDPEDSCDWVEVIDEGEPGQITGIWVDEDGLPYVAGDGVFHFENLKDDPTRLWRGDRFPIAITGVDNALFAVGRDGLLVRCVSEGCSEIDSPVGVDLLSVFALSPTQAYAVGRSGEQGLLVTYDGESATASDLPLTGTVRGIWGSSVDHLIAVGEAGIATWDGSAWEISVESSDEQLEFYAVSGSGADDVYVAEGTGFVETREDLGGIWHFDGDEWTRLDVDDSVTFYSVHAAARNDVFAAGYRIKPIEGDNQGVVYHFDGSEWTETVGCFGAMEVVFGNESHAFVSGAEEGFFAYVPED